MKKYEAGEEVRRGTYYSLGTGEFVTVDEETTTLPEAGSGRYVRVPAGVLLIYGPLAGLAFIVFLPIMGVAICFVLAARKLGLFGPPFSMQAKPFKASRP